MRLQGQVIAVTAGAFCAPLAPVDAYAQATATGSINASTPAGVAINGEVEDYTLPIAVGVDLRITKSNGVSEVLAGSSTTYTVTVTNDGPSPAVGPVATDTPGAGISCPGANAVTITGNGVPAGTFTISDLTGSGITLGTLNSGQSATLSYSCQVN